MEKLNMFMLDFGFTEPFWGYVVFGFAALALFWTVYSIRHPYEDDYTRGYKEGMKAAKSGKSSSKSKSKSRKGGRR